MYQRVREVCAFFSFKKHLALLLVLVQGEGGASFISLMIRVCHSQQKGWELINEGENCGN